MLFSISRYTVTFSSDHKKLRSQPPCKILGYQTTSSVQSTATGDYIHYTFIQKPITMYLALFVKTRAGSNKTFSTGSSILKIGKYWRSVMRAYQNYDLQHERFKLSAEEIDEIQQRRRKETLAKRAAKIKKEIDDENRFHAAMQHAIQECESNADNNRLSYLHWIISQMFTRFDYETGLAAIHSVNAYNVWSYANTHIKHNVINRSGNHPAP